ncbi:MAG: ComEC family competence protein [Bacteroidia bacterium]|nr:ComEC family competence protein [Bacteroidia bacterium]
MTTLSQHKYPFVRLLLPFALGLVCGDRMFGEMDTVTWALVLFVSSACLMGAAYFLKSYSNRWLFGGLTFLTCWSGGYSLVQMNLSKTVFHCPDTPTSYHVRLLDAPQEKERSVMCHVLLMSQIDSLQTCTLNREALLYFPKDSTIAQWQKKEELLLYASLSSPHNAGNFDEFDYARYLTRQGISATGFVRQGCWMRIAHPVSKSSLSFSERALKHREQLLAIYRKLGFEADHFAVLAALTVGYKEELSTDVREQFSVAGVSHILALSGFHVALLAGLITLLSSRLPFKFRGSGLFRLLMTLTLLWGFAFLTGLSASVIRSVSMFSILSASYLLRRQPLTLNTVACTALLMLICRPLWLFDVGFQLSFIAVVSILQLQPPIHRWLLRLKVKNKWLNGLISTSMAAQVGTLPLLLLYFHRFPTHFLLSNILVIPLVTLIIYLAVLMVVLLPIPVLASFLARIIGWALTLLGETIHLLDNLPYASIDGIWIDPIEALGCYLCLFLLLSYQAQATVRKIANGLILLCLLCTYHLISFSQLAPHRQLIFYNVRGCPAIHCIVSRSQSYLVTPDSTSQLSQLRAATRNHWMHLHLQPPVDVSTEYAGKEILFHRSMLSFGGCRVAIITDNTWKHQTASHPWAVDYLYLCKGFNGQVENLLSLLPAKCVVLDSSLSERRKRSYAMACRAHGLTCISLSDKGSVRFLL